MTENRTNFFDLKVIIGLLVLLFGVLLLLRNLGYDTGIRLWDYWPVILILIGLRILIQPRENRQFLTATILILLGILFLLNNLDIFDFRWRNIWPIIIILVGLSIIYNSFWKPSHRSIGRDYINLSMILGGGEFRYDAKDLKGGSVTAIMGGGMADLRDADMAGDEMIIDTFALMGGFEIRVPTTWQVIMHGTPILGGMENKTISQPPAPGKNPKRLIIKGTSIMGGIEVKN
jgi:predicted membrane protein